MHIISTFYISNTGSCEDNERTEELVYCILHNMSRPYVEKIHLFLDNEQAYDKIKTFSRFENYSKIHVIEVGKQPKYTDIFKYAMENLKDEICMITNADIYLHECDVTLLERLKNDNIAYAISRYEADMNAPAVNNYHGSHDCYIFKMNVNSTILDEVDFHQNHTGIESRIINALCNQGFTIYNPAYQIKIVHLHRIIIRNHRDWVGLHTIYNDEDFLNSCWYVPPSTI